MKKPKKKKSLPAITPPPKPPLVIPSAASLQVTTVQAMTDIRLIAWRQVKLEDQLAELMLQVADVSAKLKQVKEVDLPLALEAAGLEAVTLSDGWQVLVKDFLTANIKEENAAAAFKWLRDNKFGSLIKNTIKVALGKGDDKLAKALAAFMKKQKIPYERREAVHPQTLQAFVRESLREGRNLPPSIEVVSVPTTKIVRPKEK